MLALDKRVVTSLVCGAMLVIALAVGGCVTGMLQKLASANTKPVVKPFIVDLDEKRFVAM